jgi:hypothetical protein
MEISEQALVNANTIELHYWFDDETHTMNAFTQNQCEFEFLCIIKELSKIFGVQVKVETEPPKEGGLERIYQIIQENPKETLQFFSGVVGLLTVKLLITPLGEAVGVLFKKWAEQKFADPELIAIHKETAKVQLESLRAELELKRQKIEESKVIEKRRSNFFQQLEKYKKVEKVSAQLFDKHRTPVTDRHFVDRKNFPEFIMVSDEYEPEIHENAVIELISPVLKKGEYKWRGFYKGEPVSFSMKSAEFKTLVQTGQVEFKNGTSIDCFLEIRRKIDGEGNIQNAEFNIIRVNRYFDNDNPIETQEGKFHRQKKEGDNAQLKIFPQTPTSSESE